MSHLYVPGTLLHRHRAHKKDKPQPSDLEELSDQVGQKTGKQMCANAIQALTRHDLLERNNPGGTISTKLLGLLLTLCISFFFV